MSSRNAEEKDQTRAFSLIVPGNASSGCDRSPSTIWSTRSVRACGKATPCFGSGSNLPLPARRTAARNLAGRATFPFVASRLTISRIAFASPASSASQARPAFHPEDRRAATAIERGLVGLSGKAVIQLIQALWQLKTLPPALDRRSDHLAADEPLRSRLRQCDVAFLPGRTRAHHGLAAAARHHDELGHHQQHRHHHDRFFESRGAAHHFLFQSRDRLGHALDRGAALPFLRRFPRAGAHARSAFSRPDGDGESRDAAGRMEETGLRRSDSAVVQDQQTRSGRAPV